MTHLSPYVLIHLGHAAWWMGRLGEGDELTKFATLKEPLAKTTGFWREYARAMVALISAQPYRPEYPKVKGAEKYWLPYLDVVAAVTGNGDLETALRAVDEVFVRRNRDRRITDIGMDFDRNGHSPQTIDFRRAALVARAAGR
jgi:hypothetical protein